MYYDSEHEEQYRADGRDCYRSTAIISRKSKKLPKRGEGKLYYHTEHKLINAIDQSDKAYKLDFCEYGIKWIPKSICRELSNSSVYVHTATFNNIIGEVQV